MEALQIMPAMAQRRNSNLGEFAEDATVVVEEITKPRKVNHFIEANSVEVSLEHLKNDCVIPVFSKDNELTIHTTHSLKRSGKLPVHSIAVNG